MLLKVVRKKLEIAGHDIGTDRTAVHNLPVVDLQAVTIWLAVWVQVLPCKMTHSSPSEYSTVSYKV